MKLTPTQVAFRIALRWPNYVPSAKQIRAAFPMRLENASRYAQVYLDMRRADFRDWSQPPAK